MSPVPILLKAKERNGSDASTRLFLKHGIFCDECRQANSLVIQIIAEVNAGELYDTLVCISCLKKYVEQAEKHQ